MRSATCAIGVALSVLTVRPAVADADDAQPPSYRAVIDRIDLEPSTIGGLRLRVELSALALQGQVLDLTDPKAIKTLVGGSPLSEPFSLGSYGQTNADTAIAIVIQANQAYADALPAILPALDDNVLAQLGDRAQIAVLPYGSATGAGKLAPLKVGRAKLAEVSSDGTTSEPALLDTLDRALLLLKKARTSPPNRPLRKLILVIGDGHDRSGERDRVTALGVRADKAGVRIHSFGYAPTKLLRPLLTLGELSRRSLGTFRWVRLGTESWAPAFQQLRDEINKQYVLTYFLPGLPGDTDIAGKKLKIITVGRTEATSNEMKIPAAGCGGDPCAGYCADGTCVIVREASGRGVIGWLVLVVGIAVGAIVVLGLIGFVLQRRQPAAPGQPFAPPLPGQAMPGQPFAPAAGLPVAGQPAATGPSLLVMTGPRSGQRIALQNGFTIGKAPTSDLVLDDGYISSQHAQIGVDPQGQCRLYDRNSTNGTYANGVRVTEVVLDHGMSVRIGSTELRFLAQ